jgi:hypothetical protein
MVGPQRLHLAAEARPHTDRPTLSNRLHLHSSKGCPGNGDRSHGGRQNRQRRAYGNSRTEPRARVIPPTSYYSCCSWSGDCTAVSWHHRIGSATTGWLPSSGSAGAEPHSAGHPGGPAGIARQPPCRLDRLLELSYIMVKFRMALAVRVRVVDETASIVHATEAGEVTAPPALRERHDRQDFRGSLFCRAAL